jgi:hypothetical protein
MATSFTIGWLYLYDYELYLYDSCYIILDVPIIYYII